MGFTPFLHHFGIEIYLKQPYGITHGIIRYMNITIHGRFNARVPQELLQHLGRDTAFDCSCCVCVTKLVEATNGHSLVEAENAICYDIVRGYGLRCSLFWRRRVFFHGTKKQKTSVYRNV